MASHSILHLIDEGEPRRGARRRRVMLSARLATSCGTHEVTLRDVSATGARIEGVTLPAADTVVLLKRGSFKAYGQLVWVNGTSGGVLFDEPLPEEEMMEALKGLKPAAPAPEPFRRVGLNRSAHARFSDGSGWVELPHSRA